MSDSAPNPIEERPAPPIALQQPGLISLAIALVYFAVCTAYVVFSDRWVARIAGSTDLQLKLQTMKGTAFVVFSALLIFLLLWGLLRRLAHNRRALLAHQSALIKLERRAAAGLMASSVAHDMNNVLTVGMANLDLLRNHTSFDPAGAEMLNDIGQSLDRLHDMTRRMSHVNQEQNRGIPQPTDLGALIAQALRLLQRDPRTENCTLRYVGPERLTATVHENAIREALENLVLNAAEATQHAGSIEAHLKQIPGGGGFGGAR